MNTPSCLLFPYTTLFRSSVGDEQSEVLRRVPRQVHDLDDGLAKLETIAVAHRMERECGAHTLVQHVWRVRGAREVTSRGEDRKSTRLNSSPLVISYVVFC